MKAPQHVSDLIEDGRWKEDALVNWFNPWEVQAIKKIPIPIHAMEDT